jgi:hypothetical protein
VLKTKWFHALLLTATMALVTLAPALRAQDKADHSSPAGAWKMISETPDGDAIDWSLTIKGRDGGTWTATSATPGQQNEMAAKDFTVTGDKIHFKTTYQEQDYDIDLTLSGDKLQGTWSGNGDSGKTSGTRRSS